MSGIDMKYASIRERHGKIHGLFYEVVDGKLKGAKGYVIPKKLQC